MTRAAAALLLAAVLGAGCAGGPAGLFKSDPTRDHYERVLESQRARKAADAAQLETPKAQTASPEELMARGDQLRDTGDRRAALHSYLQAVSRAPESATPRARIAYLHLQQDPQRAASIFADVVQREPDSLDGWLGLALARLGLDDTRGALQAIEKARALSPDAPQALAVDALAHDQSGKHADAQRLWAQALLQRPDDAALLNNLGLSYLESGDFSGAEGAFRRALRVDPRSAVSYNNLGLALGRQADYDGALAAFRRAGPEGAALTNLGWVYHLNGDPDGAIAQYMRALDAPGVDKLAVLRNLEAAEAARGANPASVNP